MRDTADVRVSRGARYSPARLVYCSSSVLPVLDKPAQPLPGALQPGAAAPRETAAALRSSSAKRSHGTPSGLATHRSMLLLLCRDRGDRLRMRPASLRLPSGSSRSEHVHYECLYPAIAYDAAACPILASVVTSQRSRSVPPRNDSYKHCSAHGAELRRTLSLIAHVSLI